MTAEPPSAPIDGTLGFCDPTARLAFGYVMNDMGPRWVSPRTRALIDAVYACL